MRDVLALLRSWVGKAWPGRNCSLGIEDTARHYQECHSTPGTRVQKALNDLTGNNRLSQEAGGDTVVDVREEALAAALAACKLSEEGESMQGELAMAAAEAAKGELDADNFDITDELTKVYQKLNDKSDDTAEAWGSLGTST